MSNDALARALYAAVHEADPGTSWATLPERNRIVWRRVAKVATEWCAKGPIDIHRIAAAMADPLVGEVVAGMLATRGIELDIRWPTEG